MASSASAIRDAAWMLSTVSATATTWPNIWSTASPSTISRSSRPLVPGRPRRDWVSVAREVSSAARTAALPAGSSLVSVARVARRCSATSAA